MEFLARSLIVKMHVKFPFLCIQIFLFQLDYYSFGIFPCLNKSSIEAIVVYCLAPLRSHRLGQSFISAKIVHL